MKTSEANIEDLKGMVVSDGTMRPEDLIPKFLNVLKVYGKDVYDKYVGENPEVLDLSGMDDETMGWVVDELFDKLNEIAPEGYSFGSQDGDGACYGFWSVDADESKKADVNLDDLKGMVVSDGTMGVNALIRKYLAVLETYAPDNYKAYIEANPELNDSDAWMALDVQDKSYIVDELADELDKIAPEGYYFGAHEGDGACYGFWSVDADERKKCEDVPEIKVGDFVEYDKNGKEDWNWAEVTGVNEDGTLNLHITDMDKTNYDDVDHVPVASCSKLPRFAGMTDTGHYYMDGPINLYKGGWEICVTKKDLDPSKYEFIGTIDSYEDMPQVDAYYDDNYVYDEDDESEVREYFGVDFPEGAVDFADFKGDVVGEPCVKADGRSAESKKCEAYIQPVTLYSTTRYDDAEAVQSFLRDIGGDAVTVDKQRNGDVLSVNVSGSDDDVAAFVDTYKNEYGSIVKDCEVDATGWTAPEDIYYIATEQGRKELRGESKKRESLYGRSDSEKDELAGKYYVDIEDDSEGTIYSSKQEFDDYSSAEEWANSELKKNADDEDVFQASIYKMFVDTDTDQLDSDLEGTILKSDACESKKGESAESKKSEADGDSALKKMQMCLKRYKDKSIGEIAADIRYDVATALDMPADEVDDVMQKFGLDNIYILRSKGMSPKVIAQKILATKNTESLDPSIDVKGRGVVELSEDDYLKLSRDINSRGYCKDKDGGYNVWIGGSFKGTFPSVEAAADAGYTLVEGKRCEETFDPSQYEYFKVWYIINGEPYFANKAELADACDVINKVKQDGATTVELYGVNDTTETLISLDEVGCGKSESKKSKSLTLKQGVDEFIGAAPEGGWSDYWAMQQDWEFYKDSLCRDGVITQKQADSWRNPCTPDTFDRWQKRNGLVHRGYESKKSEARPTKQEEQIKELCKLCRNDKNVAESVFKALTKDYNTSLDPVLAGQYLTAKWKSKLEELGGCNGWYDGFKKLYAAMGSDFVCSVLQDLKLGSSGIGCGACITIVDTIYDKVVKRNEAKKSEAARDYIPKADNGRYDVHVSVYGENGRLLHRDDYSAETSTTYRENVKQALDAYNSDRSRVLQRSPEMANEWVEPYRVVILTAPDGENTERVYDAKLHWLKGEDWRKFGKQSESKKSESLTLKQKELKDMVRYGEAEDITTLSDVEAKELKKKGIETVGISRGVYGMNGALLRDSEGKKYVITARSSNLFYFV